MTDQQREGRIYDLHAEMCKTLSSSLRLRILNTLRERERGVSELAAAMDVPIANLSQHLNMMKGRGILTARRQGRAVYYRVANPKMLRAFDLLREVLFERLEATGALAAQRRRGFS